MKTAVREVEQNAGRKPKRTAKQPNLLPETISMRCDGAKRLFCRLQEAIWQIAEFGLFARDMK